MSNVARIQRVNFLIVTCCIAIGSLTSPHSLAAQSYDAPFRNFRGELVPTPDQLLQKLSQLQGIDLPQSTADKLMELGQSFLENLSPEQKQYVEDLAEQFRQGRDPDIPPELRGLAENIQRQMEQEGQSIELEDLLKQLPKDLPLPDLSLNRPRNPGRANGDNVVPERGRSKEDPGTGRFDRPQIPERRDPSQPELDPWENGSLFDPQQAERIAEQLRDSITGLPENEAFEPEPGMFEPSKDNSTEDSGESVGNRFDRMIMEAVTNQLNESDESRSRMAEAVSDMFSGLVDRVHTRINEHDISESGGRSTRQLSQLQDRIQGNSDSARGGFWRRFDMKPGSVSMDASAWWVAGLLITAGGFGFWLLRNMASQSGGVGGLFSRRNFRVSKIRTARELVRAVDGFLLARFGKPSSWWHSRRAEVALCSELPAMGTAIRQLVDCYEYARYSEVGGSLSDAQIQQCTSILRDLASHKTVDRSDVDAQPQGSYETP